MSLGPLAVDVRAAGMPGVLFAGDAAGFIDPMTGDGLRFALRGGELAARAALASFDRIPVPAHVVLDEQRRAEFGRKQRFNRALRALVSHPTSVRAAEVCARLIPWVVRRIVAYAGDVHASDRPAVPASSDATPHPPTAV